MIKDYCVYMHVNLINGKKYIGITCQRPEDRWGNNGKRYHDSPYFFKAIQKYGWNNFEHIILYHSLTQDEASQKEKELIAFYHANEEKYGYNLTDGGEKHYHFTEEVKAKLSKQKKGEKNPMWGTHRTQEQKQNQSELMSGGKNPAARSVFCEELKQIFNCCRDAAEHLGKDRVQGGKNISRCAKGERETAYGYHWKYIEE